MPIEWDDPRKDAGLLEVLEAFQLSPEQAIGRGGEAWVFALGDDRVLRVLHEGGSIGGLIERQELVDELGRSEMPFRVPELRDTGSVAGRAYAIERRLDGRSAMDELAALDRNGRDALIANYLTVVDSLGDLALNARPWFGDLLASSPIRCATWSEYLVAKAADGLERAPWFGHIDAAELAAAMPQDATGSFVHMDAALTNVMAEGPVVGAVIDFGVTSIHGDRRLDVLAAAVYLCADPITPGADERDRQVAMSWLGDAGLGEWYEPARRWIAAYWSWAVEDEALHRWCRSVLLD